MSCSIIYNLLTLVFFILLSLGKVINIDSCDVLLLLFFLLVLNPIYGFIGKQEVLRQLLNL